jgi:hypothetical protein
MTIALCSARAETLAKGGYDAEYTFRGVPMYIKKRVSMEIMVAFVLLGIRFSNRARGSGATVWRSEALTSRFRPGCM